VADVQSSFGYQEMNPLLRSREGQFRGRGIAIKGAVVGAAIGVQWLLVRKNPKAAGYAAGANFAAAAVTGAIVIRNHKIQ
jgi:prolipoprotein diacylglyceryltransferase